jgi:hypothetical protein
MRKWQEALAFCVTTLAVAPVGGWAAPTGPASDPAALTIPEGRVAISTYDDDPFVRDSRVESLDARGFKTGADGRRLFATDRVAIQEEPYIFREDRTTGEFHRFAFNPWPCPPYPGDPLACGWPEASAANDFVFSGDPRFPSLALVRDADGKPVLEDGVQRWQPQPNHLAMSTAFDTVTETLLAAEDWSGRHIAWGTRDPSIGPLGQILVNAHAFIDFNAFYSPSARMIFFGLVPYRLPGADPLDIHIFETSSSSEMAAHESGHALHHVLKPNLSLIDQGDGYWGESLGDQMAMWVSLRDPRRARMLLAEVHGNLLSSNSLSRTGEAFAALVGQGTALRDAFHGKTVSTTSPEVHDRSEVLTGALYRIFVDVDADLLRQGMIPLRALQEAGRMMGLFAIRAGDFVPENSVTLEDVAKGYLKVDKELFGGRYRGRLAAEFRRRQIFDSSSLGEWLAHEGSVPKLALPFGASKADVGQWVEEHLADLGIGPAFGLVVQEVIRDRGFGQTIVRVQLTEGRGAESTALGNAGILVFRAGGTLADYHPPLIPGAEGGGAPPTRLVEAQSAVAQGALREARALGLDRVSAPLMLVRRADGELAVEAHVIGGEGLESWVMVYDAEHPEGRRIDVRRFAS